MNKHKNNVAYSFKSIRTLRMLLATLIIVMVLVIISYVYSWQYDQINQLNSRIDNLNNQLLEQTKITNKQAESTYVSAKSVLAKVYSPPSGTKISSPITIMGQIPGNWSFEASFPVILKNSDGKVVSSGNAQIIGNWMTTELIPFSIKLAWTTMESGNGTLVLQKDNSSGMAENDDLISIPIKF